LGEDIKRTPTATFWFQRSSFPSWCISRIFVHSSDSKIAEVSKERILRNLEIASFLEAKYVVFHGNFNPLSRGERYINNWLERNANFWSEALKKYNITVLLENLWEPTPEMFRKR
jgi:endonuclease IV